MSNRQCCVPGCLNSLDNNANLHKFPNPDKDKELFNKWVHSVGGNILQLGNEHIFKYRRVCRVHFERKYCCRNNRLTKDAVPTINMPDMPTTTAGAVTNPQPSTSNAEPQSSTSAAVPLPVSTPPLQADASSAALELDDELMEILGEDPSRTKTYGVNIQSDLAICLQHIATTGLSQEERTELLKKYLPPANCTSIGAPVLNPEVKAAISETVYKRDKGIELKQRQTSSATSCLAEALTLLISSEPKNMALIKLLMDAIKLLCDRQYSDSVTRRSFVLNNVTKDLKDQLQATKIDKFLFGEDLSEALRAAKAITKSGADLKFTPYPPSKKPVKNKNKPHQRNLDGRGPPLNHRPR